jgi:hypothetical protein
MIGFIEDYEEYKKNSKRFIKYKNRSPININFVECITWNEQHAYDGENIIGYRIIFYMTSKNEFIWSFGKDEKNECHNVYKIICEEISRDLEKQ